MTEVIGAQRIPVIPLRAVPESEIGWGRPRWFVAAWTIVSAIVMENSMQPSSRLRSLALRMFGANVGRDVIIRPRVRVRFPWNLSIGDDAWIGEGVWISNRASVEIGHDAVVSQETFITTGSHRSRADMRAVASPVVVEPGAWITARCVVLGGRRIGRSALVKPGSLVDRDIEPNEVCGGNPLRHVGNRFAI